MREEQQPKNVLTYEMVKNAVDHLYSLPLYRKVKVYRCEYVMCHKCRHIFSYEKKYGVCDVCGKRWGVDEADKAYFVFETDGESSEKRG